MRPTAVSGLYAGAGKKHQKILNPSDNTSFNSKFRLILKTIMLAAFMPIIYSCLPSLCFLQKHIKNITIVLSIVLTCDIIYVKLGLFWIVDDFCLF